MSLLSPSRRLTSAEQAILGLGLDDVTEEALSATTHTNSSKAKAAADSASLPIKPTSLTTQTETTTGAAGLTKPTLIPSFQSDQDAAFICEGD